MSIIKKWLGLTNIPGSLGSLMGNNSDSRKGAELPHTFSSLGGVSAAALLREHRVTQVMDLPS